MDRRAGVVLLVLAACGAPSPRHADDARTTVVARGTLAYAVGFAGGRLVTVELAERFALIVRDEAGARELGRVDLGPPERDWTALACDGDRAWVGGADGVIDAIDLAGARVVATWPVGAPVTALAAAPGLVAIGDADGVLCLRRDDGALLQCVAAHDAAITALTIDGAHLVSRDAGGREHAWVLPSLAAEPPRPATLTWAGAPVRSDGRVVRRGADLVVELAGTVRGLAISPHGVLAIAAWIARLDQPSVVLVAPPR